jgi:hypothetical protein
MYLSQHLPYYAFQRKKVTEIRNKIVLYEMAGQRSMDGFQNPNERVNGSRLA